MKRNYQVTTNGENVWWDVETGDIFVDETDIPIVGKGISSHSGYLTKQEMLNTLDALADEGVKTVIVFHYKKFLWWDLSKEYEYEL